MPQDAIPAPPVSTLAVEDQVVVFVPRVRMLQPVRHHVPRALQDIIPVQAAVPPVANVPPEPFHPCPQLRALHAPPECSPQS